MNGDIHETVGELINTLKEFPEDTPLNPGYTIGTTLWPKERMTIDIYAVEPQEA